jgi:nitroreductase
MILPAGETVYPAWSDCDGRRCSMIKRRRVLIGGGAIAVGAATATALVFKTMGALDDYNVAVSETRAALKPSPEAREFVRYATLAASSHNTQPWRFRIAEKQIDISPDISRRLPVVDADDHHLFASLGCAAANLELAALTCGQGGELTFNAANGGAIQFAHTATAETSSALFDAIPKRQSTRADYDGRTVSPADLQILVAAGTMSGVDLVLITDRAQIDRIRDLVVAGNSAQMADAAFMRELKQWLRFNARDALQSGDGLFSASSGNPTLPAWIGRSMFDYFVSAKGENERYARQIASSAGIAVFVGQRDDAEHWVLAGRACQRFALQATALGLKHAFINQPVEVTRLRSELAALIGLPGRRPDIVMRFGYGPNLPFSARRPVSAVLA